MTKVTGNADLTYNIPTRRLTGKINGVEINFIGDSGGLGGNRSHKAVNPWLANNPLATNVGDGTQKNLTKDIRKIFGLNKQEKYYGPLPVGTYRLKAKPLAGVVPKGKYPYRVNIIPANGTQKDNERQLLGRSGGFQIHAQGHEGSHGCIVLRNFEDVKTIWELVSNVAKNHKKDIILKVINFGASDFKTNGNVMYS